MAKKAKTQAAGTAKKKTREDTARRPGTAHARQRLHLHGDARRR